MGYIKFYLIFVVCCTFIFFYLYVHTQPTSAKDLIRYFFQVVLFVIIRVNYILIKLRSSRDSSTYSRPPVLMYNRIPKTGSTSLMNIAYEIRSQNR